MKRASGFWLALLACAFLAGRTAGAAQAQTVELVSVDTFDSPVFVANPPGDAHRLFVVEKPGRVRIVRDGTTLAQPFLDIAADVSSNGERGLLSIAFPPDYSSSGLFYVYYTDLQGDIRIDEFARSPANPDIADPASRRAVLEIPHSTFSNHNGGQLQFGPDGLLYAGTGDGGGGGDPFENAQNLGVLLGKLLRIDPRAHGTEPYRIPGDNPFVGQPGARGEIYAYGLRNPWRFSFDRETGDLTLADVGQAEVEEVNFLLRGTGGGANFGWDVFEGTRPFEAGTASGHVPPVLERLHADGDCSITGGYVARDSGLGSLVGRYIYGDFCTGVLRSAVLRQPHADGDSALGLTVPQLSSFGEDGGGCLYVTSLAGQVYRLLEAGVPRPLPCPRPATSSVALLDGDAPETSITDGPPGVVASASVSFRFAASEPSSFECRLDGGAWSACGSPASYSGLLDAGHSFEVRATDSAGNPDSTPAARSFTVDTTAPETSITAAPPATTTAGSAIFRFASSESAARFECRLGTRPWSRCFSPASFIGLGDGARIFEVRALDVAGNTDPSPARVRFAVRRRAVFQTLQRLAQAVSAAVRSGGRAGLVSGSAIAVPYGPVVRGRLRAELRGRVRGEAVVVVARGSVAVTSQQRVRVQLRRTAAAKRLLPGIRRAWLRLAFSGADRAASIRYAQQILLRHQG